MVPLEGNLIEGDSIPKRIEGDSIPKRIEGIPKPFIEGYIMEKCNIERYIMEKCNIDPISKGILGR